MKSNWKPIYSAATDKANSDKQQICHFCYKPIRTYEDESNQRLASQINTFSVQNLISANFIGFGDTPLKFLFKDFIKTEVNHLFNLRQIIV